jgi:aldose sugar dehydrogenase
MGYRKWPRIWGDEINLVEPGFNSGWAKVQGFWPITEKNADPLPELKGYLGKDVLVEEENITRQMDMVDYSDRRKYSSPEFVWNASVGVTALKFLNSNKLGKQYENNLFIADYNNNNIYSFDLDKERTELVLDNRLNDRIANSDDELSDIVFARRLGIITDIEVGYDGHLYLVSFSEGKIYRIVPLDAQGEDEQP